MRPSQRTMGQDPENTYTRSLSSKLENFAKFLSGLSTCGPNKIAKNPGSLQPFENLIALLDFFYIYKKCGLGKFLSNLDSEKIFKHRT